jgi:hypothetical protein
MKTSAKNGRGMKRGILLFLFCLSFVISAYRAYAETDASRGKNDEGAEAALPEVYNSPDGEYRLRRVKGDGAQRGVNIIRYLGAQTAVDIKTIDNADVIDIEDGAFSNVNNAKALRRVTLPSTLTIIRRNTFENNSLTSVTIPEATETVEPGAFRNNQLTSVTFNKGLRYIESEAFFNNQLSAVMIPPNIFIESRAFLKNAIKDITIGDNAEIDGDAFEYGFAAFYDENGRQAGRFKYSDAKRVWEKYEAHNEEILALIAAERARQEELARLLREEQAEKEALEARIREEQSRLRSLQTAMSPRHWLSTYRSLDMVLGIGYYLDYSESQGFNIIGLNMQFGLARNFGSGLTLSAWGEAGGALNDPYILSYYFMGMGELKWSLLCLDIGFGRSFTLEEDFFSSDYDYENAHKEDEKHDYNFVRLGIGASFGRNIGWKVLGYVDVLGSDINSGADTDYRYGIMLSLFF